MNFLIFEGKNWEYYFSLKNWDNKILKSEWYISKSWAIKATDSVKKNAEDKAKYDHKETKDWRYYFNIKAWNWHVITKYNITCKMP